MLTSPSPGRCVVVVGGVLLSIREKLPRLSQFGVCRCRALKEHIKRKDLQECISGILLILGLRTRMSDAYVYVGFWAPTLRPNPCSIGLACMSLLTTMYALSRVLATSFCGRFPCSSFFVCIKMCVHIYVRIYIYTCMYIHI